jgi:hypothetical protein
MTAAGKINASNVTTGDRIIVKARFDAEGHERITESATKTGEGVFVARVVGKSFRAAQGPYEARGKYVIETTAGSFEAAPIQTMWLAPEDNAGVKRARTEADAEAAHRAELAATETVPAAQAGAAPAAPLALTETQIEENAAEVDALASAAAEAARDENEAPGGIYHGTAWASTSPALRTQMIGRVLRRPELTFDLPEVAPKLITLEELTLHSQACNVLSISSEHGEPEEIEMAQNLTHDEARNYPLSTGETADLIALVSSVKPSDWVQATEAQPVGTVVYAYAMGELRRGVVVKNTPTKTLVALTTAAASAPGGSVRVQTATELHTTVYVAPAPAAEPVEEPTEDEAPAECPACGGPLASDGVCADDECGADEIEADEDLTLNSHGGKVDNMNNDASATTETPARETTGSAVVQLLEKVHARIRQNHPEVPAVVIVTGSGADLMGQKWGHFRPRGWMAKVAEEGAATHLDEMFMAGETLAKGARQVLQTMLHESAHSLAEKRGEKDTSRQGRWHNKTFVKVAEELGLEYKPAQADKTIGFSAVTLTEATLAEYADLLTELDAEIHLTVRLPLWLGGAAGGDEDEGGENMPKAPKGDPKPNTNNVKCVCRCEEPNIIRMSRKVLDQAVVQCSDCESLFSAA